MHRGTTSIYRRVTMAASSGTKKICLIAVTGKPGTAYLPKKAFGVQLAGCIHGVSSLLSRTDRQFS